MFPITGNQPERGHNGEQPPVTHDQSVTDGRQSVISETDAGEAINERDTIDSKPLPTNNGGLSFSNNINDLEEPAQGRLNSV